jgi:hypothetical protein
VEAATAEEIPPAMKKEFISADFNGDGFLSAQEVRGRFPAVEKNFGTPMPMAMAAYRLRNCGSSVRRCLPASCRAHNTARDNDNTGVVPYAV